MTYARRPLVYIAGPYSADPVGGVRTAIEIAELIEDLGAAVIIPHLNLLWDLHRPATVEQWYARDLHVLARCDAVARFEGVSGGADAEVEFAREQGLAGVRAR